jgi:hypothetical protein
MICNDRGSIEGCESGRSLLPDALKSVCSSDLDTVSKPVVAEGV